MAASGHRSGGRIERPSLDFLAKAAFVLSVLMLAFGYGVATMKYKIFPHAILARAEQAREALTKLESRDRPPQFIRDLPAGDTQRITQQGPEWDNSDLILISGGFFYRTDICPKFGCLAWIMRRDGTVLHHWSADPAVLLSAADFKHSTASPTVEDLFLQGADLDRDGNLVVIFEVRNVYPAHLAIAKFAPDGRLIWRRINGSHHWPTVGPDGRIYAPASRSVQQGVQTDGLPEPPACRGGKIDQNGVRVLSPDGKVLHEFWMSDIVRRSDLLALTFNIRNGCDPFHVNGIELVNQPMIEGLRRSGVDAKPGDFFTSVRSPNAVVLMDGDSGLIKHILFGPMVQQHSPAAMPNGDLLVFDNLGASKAGARRSRLIKFGFGPDRHEQVFPRAGQDDPGLFSHIEGGVNVSRDGARALIFETGGGRLFEIDLVSGKVLWAYREADDISSYLARIGSVAKDKSTMAMLELQGAAYVSKEDFSRMFGAAP